MRIRHRKGHTAFVYSVELGNQSLNMARESFRGG